MAMVMALLRAALTRLALPALVVALWWWQTRDNASFFFPSLGTIVRTFQQMWLFKLFGSDVIPSLVSLVAGFAIAVTLGLVIGVGLATVPVLDRATEPLVDFMRSVPPVALLPIVIVFVGLGQQMDIVVIAVAAIWPTLLAARDALANMDPQVDEVLRIYRVRPVRALVKRVQSCAFEILSGFHVSLQVSFILMVVSQIVGATGGIGYQILSALRTYDAPAMWAGVILLGIIGVALNLGFEWVQSRFLALYGLTRERI